MADEQCKFTPGRWEVDYTPDHCVVLQPGYMAWHIAYTAGAFNREREEANARLIAAAPDLYAALEALANEPTADEVQQSGLIEQAKAMSLAEAVATIAQRAMLDTANKLAGRAALAKARGETSHG